MTYQYSNSGCNLVGVQRYGGPWRTYAYQAGNLLTSDTDAIGKTTTYGYDGSQRIVSMQRPDTAAPQTYLYNGPGMTTVTDPLARASQFHYDPSSKIAQIVDGASGQVMAFIYDGRGNLAHLGGPAGLDYDYDERGNLLRIESPHPNPGDPGRLETLFTYDACNQTLTTTDAMGRVTTNVYDPVTCHLLQMTDPVGGMTQFVNNGRGQPTSITDALGRTTLNSYNPAGNLTQATDSQGNVTQFQYDSLNRLVGETKPGGAATQYAVRRARQADAHHRSGRRADGHEL